MLKTCIRLARKKWGAVSDEVVSGIESLTYPQLEQLTEDLLDMATVEDLQVWLKKAARP